ncbi:Retrovirus-related Pol polyprotein from transposon TNT 1-94 [Arthroderma uncinatum]|uniref:Retrovirus-related Pol polyprotein from transposon TNT 1-94 n=1 Tax=Arthroderma uncinatum TaxID=74035 RepID=UPI00144AA5F0|nr:Retrovirus-related Pol polyprotein from transposon TNT 1-94 [Arthroderma uncinatum]KAF3483802.1 Retrovirus-related Pol polyprotein from transposon TNT 1-94 [Arthroderma uncinatum]
MPDTGMPLQDAAAADVDHQTQPIEWHRIPDVAKFNPIAGITMLANARDVDMWVTNVERRLRTQQLRCMIDGSIPNGPPDGHEDHARWEAADALVVDWLTSQISFDLYRQAQNSCLPIDTAYQLFTVIKQVFTHTRPADARSYWAKWKSIKRSDYATMHQFVENLSKLYVDATRAGYPFPPADALDNLVHGINDEMTVWSNLIMNELEQIKPADVTREQFLGYCSRTLAKVDNMKITAAAPRPQARTASNTRKGQKGAPPEGTSHEEHVKHLMASLPEEVDGKCGYCNIPGHKISRCHFLVPSARPPGWRSRGWIWAYLPKRTPTQPNAATAARDTAVGGSNVATNIVTNNEFVTNFAGAATHVTPNISDINIITTANSAPNSSSRTTWIADTGSAYTICNDIASFVNFTPTNSTPVRGWQGSVSEMTGKGDVVIPFLMDNGTINKLVVTAYYSEHAVHNLLSGQDLKTKHGAYISERDNTIRSLRDDSLIGYTYCGGGVTMLRIHPDPIHANAATKAPTTNISPETWHRRLAHCGYPAHLQAARANNIDAPTKLHCEPCALTKARRIVSRDPQERASQFGAKLHMDLVPIKPPGLQAYHQMLVVIDDATRLKWVFPLTGKDKASEVLQGLCEYLNTETTSYPRKIRCDNGTEFKQFITWIRLKGASIELSPPRSPELNGISERHAAYIEQTSRSANHAHTHPITIADIRSRTRAYKVNQSGAI